MKVSGWQEEAVFVEVDSEDEAKQKADEGRVEKNLRIAGDFEPVEHHHEEHILNAEPAREDDMDYKDFVNHLNNN